MQRGVRRTADDFLRPRLPLLFYRRQLVRLLVQRARVQLRRGGLQFVAIALAIALTILVLAIDVAIDVAIALAALAVRV